MTFSRPLRDLIVGNVWEIYQNAFEHSCSPVGIFSCGQYYPNLQELQLTVIDYGCGIPYTVKEFLKDRYLSTIKSLQWAFYPGHTTKTGVGRGIGLNLLKDFIKSNKGKLEIFSHDAYVRIDANNEYYGNTQSVFQGTLINIVLKCDESYYCLIDEISNDLTKFF